MKIGPIGDGLDAVLGGLATHLFEHLTYGVDSIVPPYLAAMFQSIRNRCSKHLTGVSEGAVKGQ